MNKCTKENLGINEILKKYWGYDQFRPMQAQIINSVLAGRDTLALLPTGGGKSITYQVPALMCEGVCIVVTPLIALMKDQVDRLRSLSIPAVAIHSGLSPRQIDIAFDNCVFGDIKFLYVSPERVASEMFRQRVQRMRVSLIAVDEAHCISQWGYDFRPSYLKIAAIRECANGAPILALTASATKQVMVDIAQRLNLKDEKIFRGSFARPNLVYAMREVEDKESQLDKVLNSVEGSGIVYVRTREAAEKLSASLNDKGIISNYYHAGLPHTERALRQEEWLNDEVRVMVATNAFGMGIDKPDVRFVVHYTMNSSLENYYQEAGRAGRDGKRSYALLLFSPTDDNRAVSLFDAEFPLIERIKEIYEKICSYLQIAIGDGGLCSYMFNVYEFCSREKLFRGEVLSAIKILEINNYLTLTDEMANPARIMFSVSRDDLYKVRVDHDDLDHFLRVILRLYEGVFTDFRQISEVEIAHWSGYTILKVKELLKRLWQMRLIRYTPSNQSPLIYLEEDRLPTQDLYISPESYKIRKDMAQQRLDSMLLYVKNQDVCRSKFFEEYFGIDDGQDCGVCDICLKRRRDNKRQQKPIAEIEVDILDLLGEASLSIKEIIPELNYPAQIISSAIEGLIQREVIALLDSGKLTVL
ncbi:MAG: ATP-dependent DNA helicase RecQ [Rikenellaceae bacterium]